jgi:hypothetical protein
MAIGADMDTETKILDELKCTVCGDVLRSYSALRCSSVKQKALELTRETVRRHRWRYAVDRDGTEVGWVCGACWESARAKRLNGRSTAAPAGSNSR